MPFGIRYMKIIVDVLEYKKIILEAIHRIEEHHHDSLVMMTSFRDDCEGNSFPFFKYKKVPKGTEFKMEVYIPYHKEAVDIYNIIKHHIEEKIEVDGRLYERILNWSKSNFDFDFVKKECINNMSKVFFSFEYPSDDELKNRIEKNKKLFKLIPRD